MPYPVAHALTGLMIANGFSAFPEKSYYKESLLIILLANLPDFDFLLVILTNNQYWHRAFSHSISTALVVGVIVSLCYLGKLTRDSFLIYSLIVLSHPLLDLLTTPLKKSLGVMLFWPLSFERIGAGLITYPFHGWVQYDGWDLLFWFAKTSLGEAAIFLPLFSIVIMIRRIIINKNIFGFTPEKFD